MRRIHATRDPTERRRLMDEHGETMQAAMSMMGGMRGGMSGRQAGSGAMTIAPDTRMHSMEDRMDIMHMREQMMMREALPSAPTR